MIVKGVKKKYKNRTILKDITFEAGEGACVGILGANGSGKSTLLKILAGIIDGDAGEFLYNGVDLIKKEKARSLQLGYVPQNTPLLEELTAKDNLSLWYSKKAMEEELKCGVLKMLGVDEFLNVTVSKMSGGMKKRLSIGCSVAKKPAILLLDEPSSALDLVCKEQIVTYLKSFKASGGTVIIATHDLHEVEICDDLYILKDGTLHPYTYEGDVQDLIGRL